MRNLRNIYIYINNKIMKEIYMRGEINNTNYRIEF
jgi:hypothetical protein